MTPRTTTAARSTPASSSPALPGSAPAPGSAAATRSAAPLTRRHALTAAGAGALALAVTGCSGNHSTPARADPTSTGPYRPKIDAVWVPSPNMTPGRHGHRVEFIVIHYMTSTRQAADNGFQNESTGVSAHFGIGEGQISQYVKLADSAWHAGTEVDNWRSIGIEHSADEGRPPSEQTYRDSIRVCTELCRAYDLDPRKDIRPHSDISPTDCPGTVSLQRIIDGVARNLDA